MRFVRHEVSDLPVAMPHRLKGSDLAVYLRHHTTDIGAFEEVFLRDLYRLPDQVRQNLESLDRPPRILDLGAHVGMFDVYMFERFPDARLTAVEPDPLNSVVLRRCLRVNDRLGNCQVLDAAASNQSGRAPFAFGLGAASTLHPGAAAGRYVEVDLVDAFDLFSGADLVKMDIEGGEWAILDDERLAAAAIPALVLEYHPTGCPSPDPRAHADRLLTEAGFRVWHIVDQGGGMGMCWAVRDC